MKVKTTLDVASNKITSLATPTVSTDAATKGYVDSNSGGAGVTSSDTAPASPSTGNLWFDSTSGSLYIYYDSQWVTPSIAASLGTLTAANISDFDAQVRTSRLDQMAAPTADVSLNSKKITSLATPTASGDAATKGYVDGAVGALTTASASLANDVTMTTANTFYSGPTASLVAGTWLVTGQATVSSANNTLQRVTARIDNNAASAFYVEAEQTSPAAGTGVRGTCTVNMTTLVTLASTTTLRIQATASANSAILRAEAGDNSSLADAATVLTAVKVA